MIGTNLLVEIFERVFRKSRAKTPLNGQYPGATSVGKKKKGGKKKRQERLLHRDKNQRANVVKAGAHHIYNVYGLCASVTAKEKSRRAVPDVLIRVLPALHCAATREKRRGGLQVSLCSGVRGVDCGG